jgi:hypothetical protein
MAMEKPHRGDYHFNKSRRIWKNAVLIYLGAANGLLTERCPSLPEQRCFDSEKVLAFGSPRRFRTKFY